MGTQPESTLIKHVRDNNWANAHVLAARHEREPVRQIEHTATGSRADYKELDRSC